MLYNKQLIQEAVSYIRSKGVEKVDIAIILGSGLSQLADTCKDPLVIPYSEIPGMHASSVKGHNSRICYVQIEGKNVVYLQGRMHMYEGFSAFQAAFATAVMAELGARSLIVTNAAGGLNPSYNPGDLMMIEDHIKTQFPSPLEGILTNDRFVDMQNAYDVSMYDKLVANFGDLKKGIYISTLGPQYETPAEVRSFQKMGGDSVGMSTVMETIMARYYKMRVIGFSMITNNAAGLPGAVLEHQDVVEQANKAGQKLSKIIEHLIICSTVNL